MHGSYIKTLVAFVSLCLSLLLPSCEGKNQDLTQQQVAPELSTKTPKVAVATVADCTLRMKNFLRWYLGFVERSDTSTMFFNWPVSNPNDPLYSRPVPKGNVSHSKYIEFNKYKFEHYMDSLTESNYFSFSYLSEKRRSLFKRGAALDASKVDEPIAMNDFNADEIFFTQELYEPRNINTLKPYRDSKPTSGTLVYEFSGYDDSESKCLLYLKNENGLCVIDSIAYK